jgi:hypothetical protein
MGQSGSSALPNQGRAALLRRLVRLQKYLNRPRACFQNRTADRTAERELSQLAAATLATGAFFMKFQAEVVWRRAADGDNPRSGSVLKTRLKQQPKTKN